MTSQTERPTFRGVICLHCQAPIPVPAIVAGLAASSGIEEVEVLQRKSQVFNLRCPCCLKEKPYRTREIVNFEGKPEASIFFPERPTPTRWFTQDGMTRTAKA